MLTFSICDDKITHWLLANKTMTFPLGTDPSNCWLADTTHATNARRTTFESILADNSLTSNAIRMSTRCFIEGSK